MRIYLNQPRRTYLHDRSSVPVCFSYSRIVFVGLIGTFGKKSLCPPWLCLPEVLDFVYHSSDLHVLLTSGRGLGDGHSMYLVSCVR